MWIRSELKERAKRVLTNSYLKSLLVSFILVLVGASGGGGSSGGGAGGRGGIQNAIRSNGFGGIGPDIYIPLFVVAGIAFIVLIAFRIFIGYAVEVGGRRFFKQASHNDIDLAHLGYSFQGDRYGDIVKTMLYKGVLNFLWYLLLIIPGIIKSYAYSMVPYILSDNPNIGYSRAVELSNQMTDGEKFDIFVLDLSFIGWYILGALLFGIGVFFVNPYVDATKAELYYVLRQKALGKGLTSPEELKLTLGV